MTMYPLLLIILYIPTGYCLGPGNVTAFTVAREGELRQSVLGNYSYRTRPDGVTTVNLNFNLLTINDLETRTQKFSISGYFTVVWDDSRLSWNASDFGGIAFIFSDETEVWRPSLVVKNAVDDLSVIANEEVPFRITAGGRVFWNPPGIYQTNCDIDTTYYPFDTQTCSVEVQSWGYNLMELDLAKFGSGVDTSEFQDNGEWDLQEASSMRAERLDGVDANTYATVAFNFKLKRKTTYYGLNIILPVIVLSILSGLVFILPADCGEKMGYSLTVLLAFAVFLTLISDRMPTTSKNTSYMAVYLSVVLCLGGISVFLTMLILDLHFREDPVPEWWCSFTRRILMPLICARGCRKHVGSAQISNRDPTEDNRLPGRNRKSVGKTNIDPAIWSGKKGREPEVVRSHSEEEEELTWKQIARYMDQLFFRCFMIAIVIVTVVFFTILGANA